MLAPTDAISLVSSVVQLVDFSSKLIAKGYELSTSADGAIAENRDTEAVTADLQNLNNKLISSIDHSRKESSLSEDDQALQSLCVECNQVAGELLNRLQKLKGQPGRNRHWRSIRQALKTVWSKDEIDEISKRLDRYRDQLNTRFLVDLRKSMFLVRSENNKAFDELKRHLDASDARILEALLDQHNAVNDSFEQNQQSLTHLTALLESQNKPPSLSLKIYEAVQQGNLERLRALLRNPGISLDFFDSSGKTPLFVAVAHGHINIVKLLFRKGANLNHEDDFGLTPLHTAVRAGHAKVARFLLSRNADKDIEDDNGNTALKYANQSLVLRWMMIYGPDIDSREPANNNTALIHAAAKGDISAVQSLLKEGADTEAKNSFSNTALLEACIFNRYDVVQVLLASGANINVKGHDDATPILRCVMLNHQTILRLLLEHGGAELKAKTAHSKHTALAEAIFSGHWEVASMLVQSGADEAKGNGKMIYKMIITATRDGPSDFMRLLLEYGARTDETNEDGWTILGEAVHWGRRDNVRVLLDNGAEIGYLHRNPWPKGYGHTGWTYLMQAAQRGKILVIDELLGRGVDINATDSGGWTALRYAIEHLQDQAACALLTRGANKDPLDIQRAKECGCEAFLILCKMMDGNIALLANME